MNRMARRLRIFATAGLAAVVVILMLAPFSAVYSQRRNSTRRAPQLKQPPTPFNQGYQKGYGEGFTQGETDWSAKLPRDFRRSEIWQRREVGSSEEYRQGYELGFELGYTDGYYGRTRSTVVPRNAAMLAKAAALADRERAAQQPAYQSDQTQPARPRTAGPIIIPNGTELRIRLSTAINTKTGRVGDTFKATVVSPSSYESATVDGHISMLNKSGRVSGKTELGLAFDSITLADGRQTRIDADLIKVYESESVKKVDEEGRIESGSRTRESEVRGGVGAAAGAIIGGIVGGGKGAIIGLILGGAAGVGSLYVEGNKDLILDPGTEMVIRIAGARQR